ncbi:hypothetical protein Pmani_026506 [Petrolisthes manimaculis]|uniref:Uncharacterized protein n=1 Tax=Petrolisthes manimaculis TaxID=1843537 RepID=A0AAE1P5X5_9EUCA|nr:hypothetical protein Pmani_026506 [Petrolisthes manimaculis]
MRIRIINQLVRVHRKEKYGIKKRSRGRQWGPRQPPLFRHQSNAAWWCSHATAFGRGEGKDGRNGGDGGGLHIHARYHHPLSPPRLPHGGSGGGCYLAGCLEWRLWWLGGCGVDGVAG